MRSSLSTRLAPGLAAAAGGGLYSFISSPTLVNVAFLGNRANSNGGGLLAQGSSITIQDAEFAGNDTSGLGAGMYLGHLVADISGVRAEGNGTVEALGYNSFSYSPFGGGGVYATSVSGQIRNSTFVDNAAAAGAGVYLAANSTLLVVNCTIADNFPGGVYTTYNVFPVEARS